MKALFPWSVLLILLCIKCTNATEPPLQHGITATDEIDIRDYWVSEKLDGIRGYWDGKQLYTRQGNRIHAPLSFTKHWPNVPLDGELWSQRGQFEYISSCVRQKIPKNSCWQKIRFMVFDLPAHPQHFSARIHAMGQLLNTTDSPYLSMVKQFRIPTKAKLYRQLNQVVTAGGEGLMLHKQDAYYQSGRNQALLKLKPYQDSEATVIAHTEGKGKYQGMLGALVVRTSDGIKFKIGTGFSDKERANPPAIGSVITFKYIGKTKRDVPRFASFLRVRHSAKK
ncbi:DNA ligase [Thalassotalea sp. G2M2-11]|uniref:DNA ligase n=1 Tax=Thalassotalea sp. G2M2-11 TaxID=2787627 RepID=UPI0019CFD6DA|nr:DNA ligase [Thalassotalea sp. G2M2-11]